MFVNIHFKNRIVRCYYVKSGPLNNINRYNFFNHVLVNVEMNQLELRNVFEVFSFTLNNGVLMEC